MDRRDVIKKFVVGGTVLVVLPAVFTSCEDSDTDDGGGGGNTLTVDLTVPANAALTNDGGYIVVSNTIVINTGGGNYTALSSVCTHEQCTVEYSKAANNLPCPCHGSLYSITGAVINGPAPNPLTVFQVTKSGNILTIQK